MATSGKGTGIVGYNVQTLSMPSTTSLWPMRSRIMVTIVTSFRTWGGRHKPAINREMRAVIADRGYFKGEEILACEETGITPLVPKPLTSGAKAEGRFGKQDFIYSAAEDEYRCPAGQRLTWRFNNVEHGLTLRHYWTSACADCSIKRRCMTGKERRIKRWEHEAVIDAMQQRLDQAPDTMRIRRQTVEHPFGTLKAWMGATHFLTKTLNRVSTEMSLHVLAYNLKRVIAKRTFLTELLAED